MTFEEYQKLAMRTNDGKAGERLGLAIREDDGIDIGCLMNGCLGVAGESGEFIDMVKKWKFHQKPIDKEHLRKELGDILWYIAEICDSCGWSMDEVAQLNIEKLLARYPNGFDIEHANHRKAGDV